MIRAVIFDLEGTLFDGRRLHDGAAAFVQMCADRFPLLAATGMPRADAEMLLRGARIRDRFLDVLGREDAARAKPAPDLFLAALGRIGFLLRQRDAVEPAQCLVVEDSPAGIAGARRAGMRTLALTHTHLEDELDRADFVHSCFVEIDLDAILRACAAALPSRQVQNRRDRGSDIR